MRLLALHLWRPDVATTTGTDSGSGQGSHASGDLGLGAASRAAAAWVTRKEIASFFGFSLCFTSSEH
jgi:hypothetical protein